jgi:excisionase family DNA binding protein
MEVLTVNEACEFLRITRATLDKQRKKGNVTAIKMGGKVLYMKADLVSFLELMKEGKNGV